MTTPRKQKPRRVLYTAGRRGDRVIVKVDTKEDRAIVYYRDADGIEHKKKWPNTRDGRDEAVAFAEGWFKERERMEAEKRIVQAPAPITLRELWAAFTLSEFSPNEGEGLRLATQKSYAQHWRRFELFFGKDRAAATIKVPELAGLRKADRDAERALNQTRQTFNVVRIVFRWGIEHELLAYSPLAVMRWKHRKDAPTPLEPGEFTTEQHQKLLLAVDRDNARQWRAWVYLILVGYYGQRDRAIRHLRWRDIDVARGIVTFDGRYQKQGRTLERPLSWEVWSALLTAKQWRETARNYRVLSHHKNPKSWPVRLEEEDWIFFAERDKAKPMSYQTIHYHLFQAEIRAGVAHQDYVAAHGFRRMVVGNLIAATGDRMLALEWVGDRDIGVLPSYDKRITERMMAVGETLSQDPTQGPQQPSRNRPDALETQTAPAEADAVNLETTGA